MSAPIIYCPTAPTLSDSTPHTVHGCGSPDVIYDGDVFDCRACGIFFGPFAAETTPSKDYAPLWAIHDNGVDAATGNGLGAPLDSSVVCERHYDDFEEEGQSNARTATGRERVHQYGHVPNPEATGARCVVCSRIAAANRDEERSYGWQVPDGIGLSADEPAGAR